MPKVLISDSMSNVAQKIFEKNNISVDVKTGLSEEEIIKIIHDYDGMVVRSATKVTTSEIPYSFFKYGMQTLVSTPPEYASTTFFTCCI